MDRENIPGPQTEIYTAKLFSSLLNILIISFFLLVTYTFVQSNFLNNNWPFLAFWKLKIIDTSNAITILVSLLGLKIAQNSFVEGLKPFLTYSSRKTKDSKLNLKSQNKDYWNITVKNQGKGPAIIRNMLFRVAFKNPRIRKLENWTDNISAVRQIFEDNNFHKHEDYEIIFLSNGAAIGSDKGESIIFEIPFEDLDKFEYIDIQIIFEGLLGHQYSKSIYCLPRKR